MNIAPLCSSVFDIRLIYLLLTASTVLQILLQTFCAIATGNLTASLLGFVVVLVESVLEGSIVARSPTREDYCPRMLSSNRSCAVL